MQTHSSVPSMIAKDVKNLRYEMKYKKGTEIVLVLSSDAMIRVVLMFPEVFYMDVTSSTNQQNRPIFLMVVKDANRQSHISNIRILPSEKSWSSMKSFEQSSFYYLEKTLSNQID